MPRTHAAQHVYERSPGAAAAPLPEGYRPRRPQATAFYRVIAEHLETMLREARDRSAHGFGFQRYNPICEHGHDVIVARASTSPFADVRHQALRVAERAHIANRIDRVSSWILDLEQATTYDQRRAIIRKLGRTTDRRTLPALRAAKVHKCVERDAGAGIRRITAPKKR